MMKTKQTAKLKIPDEGKQFCCSDCPRSFTRKRDMLRHMRIHTGEKPYSCPECAEEFSRKDDMVRHLRTHEGFQPFDCTHCERKFSRRSDLYKHSVIHAAAKIRFQKHTLQMGNSKYGKPRQFVLHKCRLCNKVFEGKRNLSRHLHTHELPDIVSLTTKDNETTTVVTNKENESQFENAQDFDDPPSKSMMKESVLSGITDTTECEVVLLANAGGVLVKPGLIQIVTTSELLQKEPSTCVKYEKPYYCQQCGDTFSRRSDMTRHLKTHNGLKPYNCYVCNRPFSRKEDMARHVLTHSNVKPYICNLCYKGFTRKTDFEMHHTIHSLEATLSEQCES